MRNNGWQSVKNWGRRVFNKSDVGAAPPDSSVATPSTPVPPATSVECFQKQAAAQAERDLWKRAYINLRDDPKTEKLMLAYDKILKNMPKDEDPIDIKDLRGPKEEMSAVVDKKLKLFATQQWKIHIGKETVVIRDQIESVVNIVKVVKDFGSSVAGLDPIHAGLPWAGVCVLLTVISTDSDQHAAVINGLEYITRAIPRYSAFETNIQKGGYPLEDVNAVQDQLIYLYSLTLSYQANAVCFFGRNTFKRFLRNIVPTTSWSEALQEIKVAAAECEQSLNTRNLQHLKETLEQQKQDVEKLLHELRQNDSQRNRVLKWVSGVPNWEDHEFVRAKLGEHYWDSGQWLFESDEYLKWEKSGSRVFWLRGAVGTGKSCLTSLVIQRHLVGDCPERQAYFYCSGAPQRSAPSNPTDILRSLVAQLSYALFAPAKKEWETKERGRGTLNLADCRRLLIELTRSAGTYTIIIDALDECSDPSELVESLNFIAESSKGLKIFFSSRLEDHITPKFTSVSGIEINQKRNQGDITAFIEGECQRRREVIRSRYPREPEQMTDDLAKKLQILLKDRAGDMFRWVELQLNLVLVIQRPLHRSRIEERLKRLETSIAVPDLNKTYDDVYDMNTEGGYGELATKAFKWVLCSFEPLHIEVLVSAVAILADGRWDETFTRDSILNRFCSNFIITDDSGIVRFAHLSVREYLERHRSELYSPLQSHTQAAISCLSLMLQPVPDSSAMTAAKRPPWREFREYANLYWPYHCEKARESRKVGDLKKLFSSFVLIQQPPYLRWLEILPKLLDLERYRFPKERLMVALNPPETFFLACTFGFEEALKMSELNTPDANMTMYGETGLYVASSNGHVAVFDRLLQARADINAQGRGEYGSALQAASAGGHDQIVQRLLENGADVNAQGGYCGYGNALVAASDRGHDQIVQRLLESRADINAQGDDYGSALVAASGSGHDQIVQRLLKSGADVNAKGGYYGNALIAASTGGHDQIVQLLLESGADVNANGEGDYYGNALIAASHGGHDQIVQRLLESGADVNANGEGDYYGNALTAASHGGHDQIVQRLLESGADANAQAGFYGRALIAASYGGHDQVVQRLLESGADINAEGGEEYGNALIAASATGHDHTVQLLLESGANVKAQGGQWRRRDALQEASYRGHYHIVQRLKLAPHTQSQ